ncbi:hypothetical protein KNV09_gp117 [Vibrio phage Athena]|uniref:Uncharacterized protein n=9 Tax=Thalassavirus TaxID=2948922 RepID=A0A6M4ETI0_9CAUD|nr:hypothetical protein KNU52_gp099 [Vibrio phage Achelous]YP_010102603.1 hypothetical protein KNU58_gp102 [Vibrio phage Brizo]YP_010102789.1 hypothetical protein KNU59_gp111 [Vibrio phage Pontus]YP_010105765.1 hypothetical protein KNU87_gp114 [Vibrio phage Bennett]YP_010105955.1 hypothetical protein KNU88_gp117 [Vibrio phage Chester]YP_010108214.1 hypothetical protein KNV06_gp115 [Vibrio phage AG74]YP_010108405.1 hypothetical protein KNV07_gp117 [Vibrio phage Cody]YP_010108600.1 hypothetica
MYKPLKASPEFIRDNQYNDKYIVVKEESIAKFNLHFLTCVKTYGAEYIMRYPSGLRCFIIEKIQ